LSSAGIPTKKNVWKGTRLCFVGIPADDKIEEARNLKALYHVENIEGELFIEMNGSGGFGPLPNAALIPAKE